MSHTLIFGTCYCDRETQDVLFIKPATSTVAWLSTRDYSLLNDEIRRFGSCQISIRTTRSWPEFGQSCL
jgi:hypothetical protein